MTILTRPVPKPLKGKGPLPMLCSSGLGLLLPWRARESTGYNQVPAYLSFSAGSRGTPNVVEMCKGSHSDQLGCNDRSGCVISVYYQQRVFR